MRLPMRSIHWLAALAAVAWLIWCPVAFALPILSAPACHDTPEEAIDCCQPLVPAPAPAIEAASTAAPSPVDGAELVALDVQHLLETPTPIAPPTAGWGRLYLSLSVLRN
jgi:hypothetical protein